MVSQRRVTHRHNKQRQTTTRNCRPTTQTIRMYTRCARSSHQLNRHQRRFTLRQITGKVTHRDLPNPITHLIYQSINQSTGIFETAQRIVLTIQQVKSDREVQTGFWGKNSEAHVAKRTKMSRSRVSRPQYWKPRARLRAHDRDCCLRQTWWRN